MEVNGVRKELRYGDERLARAVARGSDEAFEILFERHQPAILAFCRHMLGRPHDAQDAAQHTFLTAYRVLRGGDTPVALRSWLFTVARNRCISMLRARREQAGGDLLHEVTTDGLAGHVQDRADLRALLGDVAELPDDQRAALLLAEVGDFTHQEIAGVIGVRREKVKALVFQARKALMAARDARDTPCVAIQRELATARGAALRRAHLRRHLHACPSCRDFREHVRAQRAALALLLPVAPSVLRDAALGGSAAGAHASAASAVGGQTASAGAAGGQTASAGAAGGQAAVAGAAGGQATAVGATGMHAVGAAVALKATAVKVGVVVAAAGGIAAGGSVTGLPQVADPEGAGARTAPATLAGPPWRAGPEWSPAREAQSAPADGLRGARPEDIAAPVAGPHRTDDATPGNASGRDRAAGAALPEKAMGRDKAAGRAATAPGQADAKAKAGEPAATPGKAGEQGGGKQPKGTPPGHAAPKRPGSGPPASPAPPRRQGSPNGDSRPASSRGAGRAGGPATPARRPATADSRPSTPARHPATADSRSPAPARHPVPTSDGPSTRVRRPATADSRAPTPARHPGTASDGTHASSAGGPVAADGGAATSTSRPAESSSSAPPSNGETAPDRRSSNGHPAAASR